MKCVECNRDLKREVLQSSDGWYVCTFCPGCGPHSSESVYYQDRASAEVALMSLEVH